MEHQSNPYLQAASVLPRAIKSAAEQMPLSLQMCAEEFRLRTGKPPSVISGGNELDLDCPSVTAEDLRIVLGQASQYSAHTVFDQICAGYLTIRGGHRIGLCGEAAVKDGVIHAIRTLSSLAIRIARPIEGVGGAVIKHMSDEEGSLRDTLILAPPGVGKTTLLRELIRRISDGIDIAPHRVGLADERREISAMWNGTAQFDIGRRTDIMADCPKAAAAQILVRGMNPQVLAMDEITAEEDLNALLWAAGCGIRLIATAHGRNMDSLRQRPLYRALQDAKVFRQAVILEQRDSSRSFHIEVMT